MVSSFLCPHCTSTLNPEHAIILRASSGKQTLMVGLHPEAGNYSVFLPPGATVEQGSIWDFSCPVCHHDLKSEKEPNLCALNVRGHSLTRKVFFSRIAGEHATFVVNEGGDVQRHGVEADRYARSLIKGLY